MKRIGLEKFKSNERGIAAIGMSIAIMVMVLLPIPFWMQPMVFLARLNGQIQRFNNVSIALEEAGVQLKDGRIAAAILDIPTPIHIAGGNQCLGMGVGFLEYRFNLQNYCLDGIDATTLQSTISQVFNGAPGYCIERDTATVNNFQVRMRQLLCATN